jgi:hypothetical protein
VSEQHGSPAEKNFSTFPSLSLQKQEHHNLISEEKHNHTDKVASPNWTMSLVFANSW